jgi:hypothetical protein
MNGWPSMTTSATGPGSDPAMSPPNISQTAISGGGGGGALAGLFPADRKIAGLPGASMAGGVGGGLASGLGAQGIRVRQRRMSAPSTPTWMPVLGGSYPWGVGSGQPEM